MKNILILIGIVSLLLLACAKNVVLSRSEYAHLSEKKAKIEITLISGENIFAEFYTISNDTLIINEPGQIVYKGKYRKIPFDQIKDINTSRMTLLGKIATGVFAVAVSLVLAMALYFQISGASLSPGG